MVHSARLRLMFVLAVVSLTLLNATALTAQEVLTNESVMAMKKAGLSDSLILAKIRTSPTKFDVSTKGLIALKGAGLSDQIIEAMVSHPGTPGSAATPAPPAATAAPPAASSTSPRETIFHLADDDHQHLVCERCGRVEEVPPEKLEPFLEALRAEFDFDVDRRHFALVGICGACRSR